MSDIPTYKLNDGTTLPAIGFGTHPMKGEEGTTAVVSALDAGYRLLDTAVNYDNEKEVGEALRRSGIDRQEVQITTKVPGRFHRRDLALRCIEDSLRRIGVDQLDLVLIHWPNPSRGLYIEAFGALLEAREAGLTRSIGVSNFTATHLRDVVDATGVVPAVNQIEIHPLFPQEQMLAVHAEFGVQTCAWSPLAKRQAPYDADPVAAAARRNDVSPAQVILRWHLQRGVLPLPKSATPQRQRDNLDIFGFELSEQEIRDITALGQADGRLFGGDPDIHEED